MSAKCEPCGCEYWVQEQVIRLAAAANPDTRYPSTPSELRYRLRCADCGAPHGSEKPKRTRKRG